LNRNFDFHWGTDGIQWDPRAQTYPGPAAASEPETQALQQLLGSIFPDRRGPQDSDAAPEATTGICVSLHQSGELVLWPWWDTTSAAPNATGLEAIGRKFASYNGYVAGPGATALYYASGTVDDWVYGTLGVPSYTIEMGQEFMPAYGTVDEVLWPENFRALLYAAKIARTPYATALGPDAAAVTIARAGGSFTVTATMAGNAGGGEAVAVAEYYVDTPPWRSGAMPRPLAAVDGSFDGQVELVTASLSSNGLGPGRHVVYVRGQDAAGDWGPFSAGLVTIRPWQNSDIPFDVDGAAGVQVSDVLILVNSLNLQGARILPAPAPGSGSPPPFLDVTGDDWLTPQDALAVINYLNARSVPAVMVGEGEMAPAPPVRTTAEPAARGPAAPGSVPVDMPVDVAVDMPVDGLLATLADDRRQATRRPATIGQSNGERASDDWASDEWLGLFAAFNDDWLERS
jgi:hypothetical protein